MSCFFHLWMELGRKYGWVRSGAGPTDGSCPVTTGTLLRPMVVAAFLCLLMSVTSARSWAQEQGEGGLNDTPLKKKTAEKKPAADVVPPPAGMTFTTRLDRTAVWVGDQFHYLIIVEYTPDYEFVVDNLTKETVNMDPFQVMDVTKQAITLKNNSRRLFVDLTLANFGTGEPSLQIPQFTLYYFRKDHKTTGVEQAAAESLTVPGPEIGFRSTLPSNPSDIRDAITVNSWDRSRWILPVAGVTCGVVLFAGLGWELVLFVRTRKARKGPDRRKAMDAVRARWVSGVPSDLSDPKIVMEFYGHSYQNVKEYLGYYLEIATMGLTAEELQEEMRRMGAKPDLTHRAAKVLDTCESVRYGQNGNAASPDVARGVAQDIRDIFGSKR